MQKAVSLKELPKLFIAAGMTMPELCEYLGVSEELIREWEKFFNLFPDNNAQKEKKYSEKRIRDFIKIKDSVEKDTPLHEIRRKLFKINIAPAVNPFENTSKVVEIKDNKGDFTPAFNEENIIKPFLTQINRANERIGELILEKARLVEETAIEKANLISEIKILQTRNTDLVSEKDRLLEVIKEKEEQFKKSSAQETTLAEALNRSHEMLRQKEDDISHIKSRVELYEQSLREKDSIIYNQSIEINNLLEKQNKKWWHCLRDIFF